MVNHQAISDHLRALGYKKRGGVDKGSSDRDEGRAHFSSSFTHSGVKCPLTMIGHQPQSGRSATIKALIIPLRINYINFSAS